MKLTSGKFVSTRLRDILIFIHHFKGQSSELSVYHLFVLLTLLKSKPDLTSALRAPYSMICFSFSIVVMSMGDEGK